MEIKKSAKASLENKRLLFTEIGFVIALLVVYGAFEYSSKEKAASILADMTLEQKITQMIFPALRTWGPKDSAVNTVELNDELHEIFTDYSFGGVTLYGANIVNTEQTLAEIYTSFV